MREVRIDDGEIVRFGDIRCTSPVRTGFDLLRDPTLDDDAVVGVVAALLSSSGPRSRPTLHERLDAAVRMPHKAAARRRLEPRGVASADQRRERAQPSLTR